MVAPNRGGEFWSNRSLRYGEPHVEAVQTKGRNCPHSGRTRVPVGDAPLPRGRRAGGRARGGRGRAAAGVAHGHHPLVPRLRGRDVHHGRRRQGPVDLPRQHPRRLGAAGRQRPAGRHQEQGIPRRGGGRGHARREGGLRVQGDAVGGEHGAGRRRRPVHAHRGRPQAAADRGGPGGQGAGRGAAPGADEGHAPPDPHGPQAQERQLPGAAATGQGGARVHAGGEDRVGGARRRTSRRSAGRSRRSAWTTATRSSTAPTASGASRWTRRAKSSGS